MSRAHRGFIPLFCLGLITLASCRDTISSPDAPESASRPLFAQGDLGIWTVNTLDDPGDGVCDDTECTLREAIDVPGDHQIEFIAGLQGDIKLTAGQLSVVDKDLTIDGDGRITVDAQRLSRVFDANGGSRPRQLTLKGLTVKNGNAAGQDGGGIRAIAEASLRLENVSVLDSETMENGGGIWTGIDGGLAMINSTVQGNRAAKNGGGIYNLAELDIVTSTISRNVAAVDGAGIFSGAPNAPARLDRTTVSGNRASPSGAGPTRGGGILLRQGALEIRSSTITDNSAEGQFGQGGGLYVEGTVSMANSILAGNSATLIAGDCADFVGTSISLGYNLYTSGNVTNCFFTPAIGDQELSPAQIFTEVLEQTLKNNGGPTETHAHIVRGRAMDAGYCPGETEDQRGLLRPVDVAVMPNAVDGCDIGAYEAQGPVIARTDLMVSQSADKASVKAGDLLTYTVRVRNLGPELAPNTVLTNVLSNGVAFVSATHAKGTHTAPPVGETGTVTWTLGDLLDQADETAEIKVTVRIRGKTSIVNTASVTADIVDLNPANNTASLRVTVGAGGGKIK
jgi:uncharacterized repeat protein (TIGR01451 family)/CSLREA domain-containing protein